MTSLRLILRSLGFHWRSQVATLLGAAIASAVLIGALVVGDSVRGSLRDLALQRLGQVGFALASGDRLFRASLGTNVAVGLHELDPTQTPRTTALLQLPAVASSADGSARANAVQLFGVDASFWPLVASEAAAPGPVDEGLVLNLALAGQLRAKPGDTVLLRIQKPSALSRDAPLSTQEDASVALRLPVSRIVDDRAGGRFALAANQASPFNAFLPLAMLAARVGVINQANLLLVQDPPARSEEMASALPGAVRRHWQLADAQLELRALPAADGFELRSPRVFLDAPVADAVLGGLTNGAAGPLPASRPRGVLTYFVNELRHGERSTPYSMVAALDGLDLGEDEMLVNQWLADDLAVQPGDELALRYFVVGAGRALEERTAKFRVRAVLPMTSPLVDRGLMPDFPGMTGAANCRDWDTGLPIQTDLIRDVDEKYWENWRGTPKAIIGLKPGQRLWENRFGNLTAVRFQPPTSASSSSDDVRAQLESGLRAGLDPAAFGLVFEPVRERALAASRQGQDFGQLFVGFSFFLIAAALLLLSVVFQFGIEQRATEVGTLLALGFSPRRVRWLLLGEGGCVALVGGALGALGGLAYAWAMLRGLSTVWSNAVGGVSLGFHVQAETLALGLAAAALVILGTMWLALRSQLRRPTRELLASGAELEFGSAREGSLAARNLRWAGSSWRADWTAIVSAFGAVALVGLSASRRDEASAGLFFGAGALLLLAGLAGCAGWLGRLAKSASAGRLSVRSLGVRSATRRHRRSLAVIGLLACGSFLIASIGVFRLDAVRDAAERSSGTGGFALIGESSQPVVEDLNGSRGREVFGFDTNALAGVGVVPFRVRDGDDASCLNLNRAQRPRLLGVNPAALNGRFTFARIADGVKAQAPWTALTRGEFYPRSGRPLAGDEVAAIGDAASIQWALGKQIGDTIPYTDERGREFKLRLVGGVANSILQGSLIIAEDEFVQRFPSGAGYRMFLVDAPSKGAELVSAELTRGLRDLGLELQPAAQRLAAFNAVQNTYLGTFQVLGGLGLVLGSVGLGGLVLRNVLERRGELAVLLAVGWRRDALQRLILAEHGALLLAGLGVGVAAALVAVAPTLGTPGQAVPYASLALTLLAVLLNGALWTWLATLAAMRGRLIGALSND